MTVKMIAFIVQVDLLPTSTSSSTDSVEVKICAHEDIVSPSTVNIAPRKSSTPSISLPESAAKRPKTLGGEGAQDGTGIDPAKQVDVVAVREAIVTSLPVNGSTLGFPESLDHIPLLQRYQFSLFGGFVYFDQYGSNIFSNGVHPFSLVTLTVRRSTRSSRTPPETVVVLSEASSTF